MRRAAAFSRINCPSASQTIRPSATASKMRSRRAFVASASRHADRSRSSSCARSCSRRFWMVMSSVIERK